MTALAAARCSASLTPMFGIEFDEASAYNDGLRDSKQSQARKAGTTAWFLTSIEVEGYGYETILLLPFDRCLVDALRTSTVL
jgi:hypothetical protein